MDLDEVLFVSPDGSDSGAGTLDEPWGSVAHALAQLQPGDTLYLREGTYRERIRKITIREGSKDAPIEVRAYPGERPVVQGILWLSRPSYWLFDGVNVTWDAERNDHAEHMVKLTNGVGWTWRNSEIWGARSFSGILIASNRPGEPAHWTLEDNCVHDTYPSNDDNQDSNIYVGDMTDAGPGLVEHNLVFNAENGRNIKLGAGETADDTGPTGVTVRYNTLYNAAVPIVIAGGARDILIEQNILGVNSGEYLIRGYELSGADVAATDNVGFGADHMFAPESGSLVEGPDNQMLERFPFANVSTCDGFRPVHEGIQGYGHRAGSSSSP